MKKLAILCLSVVMLLSLGLTVFAAPGGFVSSPSGNPAPELIDSVNKTEGCTAQLKITPYSERNTLDDGRSHLEMANARGITVSACKKRVQRAKEKLKNKIKCHLVMCWEHIYMKGGK